MIYESVSEAFLFLSIGLDVVIWGPRQHQLADDQVNENQR